MLKFFSNIGVLIGLFVIISGMSVSLAQETAASKASLYEFYVQQKSSAAFSANSGDVGGLRLNLSAPDSSGYTTSDTVMFNPSALNMPKWYDMVWNVPGDWLSFYKTYMTKEYIPTIAAIAIATTGLIASDESTWRASERWYNSSSWIKGNSEFFKEFGDGRTQFGMAALFAAGGFIAGDKRMLKTASQVVEVVLAAGGMVQVFKHITGRESPFTEDKNTDGGKWRFFPNQIQYHKHVPQYDAYPSGHICTTIATFIVIQDNYPEYPWIEPLGWVAATLVGVGMVNTGIHWYSDYPLGLAMGYGFAKVINPPAKKAMANSTESSAPSLSVFPFSGQSGQGIGLQLQF